LPFVFALRLFDKKKMTRFFATHEVTLIGILVGAIGGYAYYLYVGCVSGDRWVAVR
jgi:hypothetical protein